MKNQRKSLSKKQSVVSGSVAGVSSINNNTAVDMIVSRAHIEYVDGVLMAGDTLKILCENIHRLVCLYFYLTLISLISFRTQCFVACLLVCALLLIV